MSTRLPHGDRRADQLLSPCSLHPSLRSSRSSLAGVLSATTM